jgi:hypothetical protein
VHSASFHAEEQSCFRGHGFCLLLQNFRLWDSSIQKGCLFLRGDLRNSARWDSKGYLFLAVCNVCATRRILDVFETRILISAAR